MEGNEKKSGSSAKRRLRALLRLVVTVAIGSLLLAVVVAPVTAETNLFSVKVQNTGGTGIPGMTVEVLDATSGSVVASGTTGSDGRAGFSLAGGSYNLRVSWAGVTLGTSDPLGPKKVYNVPPDTSATITLSVTWATGELVTFAQVGVGTDFTGTVLTVDGTGYGVSQLPKTFNWDVGSSHTFAYHSPLVVGGKQYVWTHTDGLSSAQSGTIAVPSGGGSVTGNYKTQYYLTVKTDPLDLVTIPGEGWYDECTTVSLPAPPSVIKDNTFYLFDYWDVDGASQGADVNEITVHMDASHWATAHYTKVISVNKELTSGNPEVPVGTRVNFTMVITVHAYEAVSDVVVKDGIGADLVLDSYTASDGTVTYAKAGKGKMGATIVTWMLPSPLEPCTNYTLTLEVYTGKNPQGKQEYTSPGDKYLNSGPVVYFTYNETLYMLQGPRVTVTAVAP